MRFVDEYRAPEQVMQLIEHLSERAAHLPYTAERPLRIMEVCGGHTHAIFKFGLDQLLPENVEFIHGPGCPVCVLPMGRIDSCVEIASHPEVIFCTFGDAMRVPGKQGSLLQAKARGADIRIVYSPMDALKLAQENPTRKVVFFGLGFETTMPTTAITLQQAKQRDVQNFYFFCQHITLIPTLRSLLEQRLTGVLLIGEPDSGKTTLLRSIAQALAARDKTVCVIDERREICPGATVPYEQKTMSVDEISGLPKAMAVQMALRTLSPQFILLDELGGTEEVRALEQGMFSGAAIIATLHASSWEEAFCRPQLQEFRACGALQAAVLLRGRDHPGQVAAVRIL